MADKKNEIELPKAKEGLKELKTQIRILAACQVSNRDIAVIVKIGLTKLTKRYRNVLVEGRALGRSEVLKIAFKMATGGRHPAVTLAFLKTHCPEWRAAVDNSGEKGEDNKKSKDLKSVSSQTSDPMEASRIYQQIMNGS